MRVLESKPHLSPSNSHDSPVLSPVAPGLCVLSAAALQTAKPFNESSMKHEQTLHVL